MAKNAFGNAAAMLGGLDQFYAESDEQDVMLDLTEIHVKEQVRKEFEDGEHSIQQMADSMTAHGQIQAILVRPMPDGGYELVAGERRYRGAKLLNWTQIRARIRQMTDEEAEDIQYAENVHRKNLTQAEEAKKLARDLEKLGGDRAALCAKHNLTKSYVSKILAVLDLQEQGQRLLNENITSDLETINSVRRLEKQVGPEAAQEVVDELAAKRGGDKREIVSDALVRHGVKKDKKADEAATDGKAKGKATPQPAKPQKPQKPATAAEATMTLPGVEDTDAMSDDEFLGAVADMLNRSSTAMVCESNVARRAEKLLREQFKIGMDVDYKNITQHALLCFRSSLHDVTGADVLRFIAYLLGTKAKGDSDFSLRVTLAAAENEMADW